MRISKYLGVPFLSLLALGCMLLAASCGGSNAPSELATAGGSAELEVPDLQQPVIEADDLLSLPAPSTLVPPKQSSVLDHFREAGDFSAAQPNNRVEDDFPRLTMTPDYPASGFGGLSYAFYHFSLAGYDRNNNVHLEWPTPPAAGDLFLGFSQWNTDSWQWYGTTDVELLTTGDMAQFISGTGDLYVVVAVTGATPCSFGWIRVGTPAPISEFTMMPSAGVAPLEVGFNEFPANPVIGVMTRYEWDFDGDGTYDYDKPVLTFPSYTYDTPGEYHPTLRVTNTFGLTAVSSQTVTVSDEWHHTWGNDSKDNFTKVVSILDGSVVCIGEYFESTEPPTGYRPVIAKYSPVGELEWVKTWNNDANQTQLIDIAPDFAGNFWVVGSCVASDTPEMLVQCYSPEGGLLQSFTYGTPGQDEATSVAVSFTEVIVTGLVDAAGSADILTTAFDYFGTVQWSTKLNLPGTSANPQIGFTIDIFGETDKTIVAFSELDSTFILGMAVLDSSGGLVSNYHMSDGGQDFPLKVLTQGNGVDGFSAYILMSNESTDTAPVLVKTNIDDKTLYYIKRYLPTTSFRPYSMYYASLDSLCIVGDDNESGGPPAQGYMLTVDLASGAPLTTQKFTAGTDYCRLGGVFPVSGSLAICGFATNATTSWANESFAIGDGLMSWVDYPTGMDSAETITTTAEPGVLADAPSGVEDTGAGEIDAYIAVINVPTP